jgi:organic radical activating enzyme
MKENVTVLNGTPRRSGRYPWGKPAKKDKYLSIITNFGCHFSCPYCIVKNNGIDVPKTTMESLLYLEDAVKETGANIISLSGGGDPMYEYEKHKDYYKILFDMCDEMEIPIELHTSYTKYVGLPYWRFNRIVYHLHNIDQIMDVLKRGKEIVRIVFVVTEDFTPEKIMEILAAVIRNSDIDELSFRQMVDSNYEATKYCQEFLRKGHKKWWYYIEQNDYNDYFVNGKIYKKFSEIHSEV